MTKSFIYSLIFVLLVLSCKNITQESSTSDTISNSVFTVNITSMRRNTDKNIIEICLDKFPSTWGNWKMYLDGKETPMEGGSGEIVVRPNAALDKPPTGLLIGTLPWLTGLTGIDFPLHGLIQFYIPGEGYSNKFYYNLENQSLDDDPGENNLNDWTNHYGDLVIENSETRIIENEKYFQQGNIYVNDNAKLIIKNSQLMMGRGDVPTIHVCIFVAPNASVEIENSKIFPDSGLVCVINHGKVKINDSPTSIHYFDMSDGAYLTMINSEMVFTIGGLLQVTGGETTLVNSKIGALGLKVPANAHLNISNLKSGVYFESWDVHDMIPEANYKLTLTKTEILKDDFTGELEHGPYERGWLFFLDPDSHVRISNSELRKVFIDVIDGNANFRDLKVGVPSNLKYKDIELDNVTVMGQWPFYIKDSKVTISNSDYLFLQPTGNSAIAVNNSHICEFIPRDFLGTINFSNGLWTTAGEILGGVPYHSMENNFSIKGSLKIEGVQENLQWNDATVTREYDILVLKKGGKPIENALLKINGEIIYSDNAGKAKINIRYDEFNFKESMILKVITPDNTVLEREVSFFSETPIIVVEE